MTNKLSALDLAQANKYLKNLSPIEIIQWTMTLAKNPILTTNFGPYSASLIHAVNCVDKNMNVVWCDTGHNTTQTYGYALDLIDRFSLNMHIYKPDGKSIYSDKNQRIPYIDNPEHKLFTEAVKLEPFRRA